MFDELLTPVVLIDEPKMQANIEAMQKICDDAGTELRPHIKTHKMIEAARRQLLAGAAGITCAKLSEAEALLPAFDEKTARSVFIAHSLVDERKAPRLKALAQSLDELLVACTSVHHAPALEKVLAAADIELPVMMAFDTGLGREGARGVENAVELAKAIIAQPHLKLHGIYTHEGHMYGTPPEEADAAIAGIHAQLLEARDAVQAATGLSDLKLWPGCSASAARMAVLPEVDAVRPGAYLLGDLALAETTQVMDFEDVAISILATVVDKPEPGLALIDAGSKVFSSDKTRGGFTARAQDGRDISVLKCNEEHGYVVGSQVDELQIGERLRFVPAHVCTVVNLTDKVTAVRGEEVLGEWEINARGHVH